MITRNIYYWSMIESMVFTQVAWMLAICLNYSIFIIILIPHTTEIIYNSCTICLIVRRISKGSRVARGIPLTTRIIHIFYSVGVTRYPIVWVFPFKYTICIPRRIIIIWCFCFVNYFITLKYINYLIYVLSIFTFSLQTFVFFLIIFE